jgi:hypothetical protein
MNFCQPPYTITPEILNRVAAISEAIGRLTVLTDQARAFRLRASVAPARPCARDIQDIRVHNRIRTIHGSLAIEGNTLSEAQITAILEGKRVIAPPREVQEVKNALAAYDRFDTWKPESEKDLLEAHRMLMSGLIDEAGIYRHSGVGVMAGQQVIHMAPPADRVPQLIADLFRWLAATNAHPLIASSVFHYEFEFIHPFADGNGRMGRLWQSLILARWNPLFADIPVESLMLFAAINGHRLSDYMDPLDRLSPQWMVVMPEPAFTGSGGDVKRALLASVGVWTQQYPGVPGACLRCSAGWPPSGSSPVAPPDPSIHRRSLQQSDPRRYSSQYLSQKISVLAAWTCSVVTMVDSVFAATMRAPRARKLALR